MRRLFLLLVGVVVCLAQTSTPPAAISAYYRLAGNAAGPFPYQWLVIDSPLSLRFDGTSPHLSATLTTGPAGPQGLPGATGAAGAQGIQGSQGPTGAAGSSGSVTGMTVETGCSSTNGCTVLGTATTLDVEPGFGILCVPQLNASTLTIQCVTDTAIFAFRVNPPKASGPCVDSVTGLALSASSWAADSSYFYTCVSNGATPPVFQWARIPLTTGW